jgi:hypothetical protein
MTPSNCPIYPSLHNITREEIRLTIQLHLLEMYRRSFLRKEFDKMLEVSRMKSSEYGRSSGTGELVYDRVELRNVINAKLRLNRSLIKRQAHYIDEALYRRAASMDDYYNLDDLGERMNDFFTTMNQLTFEVVTFFK